MKPREVLAFPVDLMALGVLALRLFLQWIFSIPKWIISNLDALYYRMVQLRRRITGEPLWKPLDYTSLRINPPNGWATISLEHRAQMEADNWVFIESQPDLPPWHCAPIPDLPDLSNQPPEIGDDLPAVSPFPGREPSVIVNPEMLEEKEPTP